MQVCNCVRQVCTVLYDAYTDHTGGNLTKLYTMNYFLEVGVSCTFNTTYPLYIYFNTS